MLFHFNSIGSNVVIGNNGSNRFLSKQWSHWVIDEYQRKTSAKMESSGVILSIDSFPLQNETTSEVYIL